jgi:hypothetical protein
MRLRLTNQQHVPRVGYGYRKLNSDLVNDKHCEAQLTALWASLIRLRQNYGDDVLWCSRICKTKIHRLYLREQASRRREQKQMENHLYECIQELLLRTDHFPNRFITLKKLKAQIVLLHSDRLRCVLNENADNVRTGDDHPPFTTLSKPHDVAPNAP